MCARAFMRWPSKTLAHHFAVGGKQIREHVPRAADDTVPFGMQTQAMDAAADSAGVHSPYTQIPTPSRQV